MNTDVAVASLDTEPSAGTELKIVASNGWYFAALATLFHQALSRTKLTTAQVAQEARRTPEVIYGAVGSLANSLDHVSKALGFFFELRLGPTGKGEEILQTLRQAIDSRGISYAQCDRAGGFQSSATAQLLHGTRAPATLRSALAVLGCQLEAACSTPEPGRARIFKGAVVPKEEMSSPTQDGFYLRLLAQHLHDAICQSGRTMQDVARGCDVGHMRYVYKAFAVTADLLERFESALGYRFDIRINPETNGGPVLTQVLHEAMSERGFTASQLAEQVDVLPAILCKMFQGERLVTNVLGAFDAAGYQLQGTYVPLSNFDGSSGISTVKRLRQSAKRSSTAVAELLKGRPQPQWDFSAPTVRAQIGNAETALSILQAVPSVATLLDLDLIGDWIKLAQSLLEQKQYRPAGRLAQLVLTLLSPAIKRVTDTDQPSG